MTNLTPWRDPIAFPATFVPYGSAPFRPTLVTTVGTVVTGGHQGLCVVPPPASERAPFTIPARVYIAGFASHGGNLFVQDGTVTSCWALADASCHAAVNLLAPAQRWSAGPAPLDDAALAALHALPADLAAKRDALARARRRAEWAHLLDDTNQAVSDVEAKPASMSVPRLMALGRMALDLETLITGAPPTSGPAAQSVYDALAAASADAGAVDLSGPAIGADGTVFVLAGDGTIYPLTAALALGATSRFDPAAVPSLAMSESSLQFVYRTPAGQVRVVACGTLPVTDAGAVAGAPPNGAPVLPLTVQDGLLWGGGMFGADFFGMTLDHGAPAPSAPRVTLAHDAAPWRDYQVSDDGELALVSSAGGARLVSYTADAKHPDRWGKHEVPAASWLTFWPARTASESVTGAADARPLLVFETTETAAADASGSAFRVFLANTIDSADPFAWGRYPPKLAPLGAGVLQSSATNGAPRIAWVRARPLVAHDTAWLVTRSATTAESVRALATPDAQGSPWHRHQQTLGAAFDTPAARAEHLGELPLPPSDENVVHLYSIAALGEAVVQPARTQRDEILLVSKSIPLRVTLESFIYLDAVGTGHLLYHDPEHPFQESWMFALGNPAIVRRLKPEADGLYHLDPHDAGQTIGFPALGTCVLHRDTVNVLNLVAKIAFTREEAQAMLVAGARFPDVVRELIRRLMH